jgi:SPP1 family phage portal protein
MSISAIPDNILSGRSLLRTDLTEFTAATIKTDLARVIPQHNHNANQIQFLQDYLKGWHPTIQERIKTTRTDVDNKITVDYAYSITRDIVGYFLGKPIQYTNRNGKFRKQMENFINSLSAENKALVDYQIAEDCSICGVGYRGIFSESAPRNGTALKLLRLDPRSTFVVYPSDPTKPAAYAVTSYQTQGVMGAETVVHYKVYTPSQMFLFKAPGSFGGVSNGADLTLVRGTDISFGGGLPIVEYQNNLWRLGDWEMAVSIMDALDAVTSDGVNDIQQAVNAVLVVLGADMDDETFNKLSTHGFLSVSNIPVGVKPEIKFISEAMSADVGVALRDYLEATLRVIVGVPDRKTRGGGGGDTGDAVFMRDGWQDIDLVATAKEPYFVQAEREALATILYILDTNDEVSNIKAIDIDIHFNRNKTANLQSKAQVFQTLTAAGLAPEDALDIAALTNNVHDVILRMEAFAQKNAERLAKEALVSNDKSDSKVEDDKSKVGDEGTTA